VDCKPESVPAIPVTLWGRTLSRSSFTLQPELLVQCPDRTNCTCKQAPNTRGILRLAQISHHAGEGRGFAGCGKTRLACHSEESRSDRDDEESRTALKILRARFLAPLGMTTWRGFPAACKTPPFRPPNGKWKSMVRNLGQAAEGWVPSARVQVSGENRRLSRQLTAHTPFRGALVH
jgi:hypothetical protein